MTTTLREVRPNLWLTELVLDDFDVRGAAVVGERRVLVWDMLSQPSDMAAVKALAGDLPHDVNRLLAGVRLVGHRHGSQCRIPPLVGLGWADRERSCDRSRHHPNFHRAFDHAHSDFYDSFVVDKLIGFSNGYLGRPKSVVSGKRK